MNLRRVFPDHVAYIFLKRCFTGFFSQKVRNIRLWDYLLGILRLIVSTALLLEEASLFTILLDYNYDDLLRREKQKLKVWAF